MTSPDGKIRIPLNESQDDKSQIEEFLREYKGEGIQHIALGTSDIYQAVRYPARPRSRLPGHAGYILRAGRRAGEGHGEPNAELEKRRILVDGARPRARACCCRSSPRM
jgi:4-hydroxyphenylpyruvate dioxygenase